MFTAKSNSDRNSQHHNHNLNNSTHSILETLNKPPWNNSRRRLLPPHSELNHAASRSLYDPVSHWTSTSIISLALGAHFHRHGYWLRDCCHSHVPVCTDNVECLDELLRVDCASHNDFGVGVDGQFDGAVHESEGVNRFRTTLTCHNNLGSLCWRKDITPSASVWVEWLTQDLYELGVATQWECSKSSGGSHSSLDGGSACRMPGTSCGNSNVTMASCGVVFRAGHFRRAGGGVRRYSGRARSREPRWRWCQEPFNCVLLRISYGAWPSQEVLSCLSDINHSSFYNSPTEPPVYEYGQKFGRHCDEHLLPSSATLPTLIREATSVLRMRNSIPCSWVFSAQYRGRKETPWRIVIWTLSSNWNPALALQRKVSSTFVPSSTSSHYIAFHFDLVPSSEILFGYSAKFAGVNEFNFISRH